MSATRTHLTTALSTFHEYTTMKYTRSPELEQSVRQLAASAGLSHIDFSRTACVISQGSKAPYTLARCHALPKIMQDALDIPAHYVIEIVAENFFKLSEEEQVKTLLHELMHIPKTFGGGFRHHDHVSNKNVNQLFKQLGKPKLPSALPAPEKPRTAQWPAGLVPAARMPSSTLPANKLPKGPKGESIFDYLRRKSGRA